MTVRPVHLLVGVATVLVFLGTGLYMRSGFPELYEGNETIRYLFRANHVYLLFSGLVNILLGVYRQASETRWKSLLQSAGSWILVFSPALFLAAFVFEPPQASPMRPVTLLAVFLTFFGVVAHMIGGLSKRIRSGKNA